VKKLKERKPEKVYRNQYHIDKLNVKLDEAIRMCSNHELTVDDEIYSINSEHCISNKQGPKNKVAELKEEIIKLHSKTTKYLQGFRVDNSFVDESLKIVTSLMNDLNEQVAKLENL
jgi:hypothetical protein